MFKRGDVVEHVRGDRKETRTRPPYFAEIGTVVGVGVGEDDEYLVQFPSGTWFIEPRYLVLFDDRPLEENPMKEPMDTSDMDFTDSDWESAADEARAAGHRVDKTERGYEVYPHGEEVVGGPSMIFPTDGDDPAGGIRDLKRMAQMKRNPINQDGVDICGKPFWIEHPSKRKPHGRTGNSCSKPAGHGGLHGWPHRGVEGEEVILKVQGDHVVADLDRLKRNPEENPPRFREGDRVVFDANPAALMMYTTGTYPPVGTRGSVTTVQVPGRGRSTNMPGPRGGLVYVKWDDWGVVGVFAQDLKREKTLPGCKASTDGRHHVNGADSRYCSHCLQMVFKRNPGCECQGDETCSWCVGSWSPSSKTDLVEIDDSNLVERLFDWHSGQGDPVYAVASSSNAGRKVTRALVDDAIANLSNLLRKVKGKDKKDLEKVIEDLMPYGT